MSEAGRYAPGPAQGARVEKDGEKWTLIVVRELRHAPEMVWHALTDPAQLREWAPYDADRSLDAAGADVRLTWVSTARVSEATVTRADPPRLLEVGEMRWELEAQRGGTRLTLWHKIDRRFVTWGAAGWHICLDVLERRLDGDPIGRLAGSAAAQSGGWQRLTREYAQQFGVKGA